ncbi:hypothetical protein K488DRAFT_87908 [Vararia minispora EC-137]|uniref:Uncharacterized protein n=1 Tax=Vararia minispora EC-137 TaxID=1314806 RepID=A0ACB8QF99_9AGAM|nr:hypothetical protein K488DRAFT_87908 [Vararia minispora EC-137]
MATFSWSDYAHAVLAPCLACLRAATPHPHLGPDADDSAPRNRFDDLERLLAESSSSLDAETLSLHSTIGSGTPRRARRRSVFPKTITLFGFHLFGRPPIHLPDGERDAPAPPASRPPLGARSSSTLDSDAAPLDAAAIAARAREEAERAERRAQRRARKEMRRAALALAMDSADPDGAFEGFQGSGGAGYSRIPAPFVRTGSDSGSGSGSGSGARSARVVQVDDDDDEEADGADFDARAYTRRAPGGSSAGGSDSRSRTSASYSAGQPSPLGAAPAPYDSQAALDSQQQHLPPHGLGPLPPKKKKKAKSAASSSAASTSVASPAQPAFPALEPLVVDTGPAFEGFTDDSQDLPSRAGLQELPTRVGAPDASSFPSAGLSPANGFPSAGFGGRGPRKSDLGAFLASK